MILSEMDRAILAELTNDPFASNATVAQRLGVSVTLVTARLRILQREKVSQILAVLDLDHMRQSFCVIQIQVRGRAVADVVQDIVPMRTVLMVSELANGTADLMVMVRFETLHELHSSVHGTLARVPGIHRWQIDIVADVPVFRSEYVTYSSKHEPMEIERNVAYLREDIPEGMCDDTDLYIIAHLQQNAHQSINNIARTLKIKPSTARYRINNLKSSDILRFVRVIDRSSVDIGMFALVEIDAEINQVDKIIEQLHGKEWLPQLFHCIGRSNLICIVLSDGTEEALRIKREEILSCAGVHEVRLSHLHTTHKVDFRWAQKSA